MKKSLLFLINLIFVTTCWSQSILLVTDNNFTPDDNTKFSNALSLTTYSSKITVFNAVTEGSAPSLSTLEAYDLVIWFCGDDSSISFWEAGKTGLPQLKTYLNNDGKLWLIGKDIIYNFYSAPFTFSEGDFLYDYVGLSSYNMQSFADDGSTGAPQIEKTSQLSNDFPSPISWIFSTIYYIDGVTVREEGVDMYKMGPSSYTGYGEVTMTYFKNDDTNVIGTFFNPAAINTDSGGNSGRNSGINDLVDFTQASMDAILNSTLSLKNENINKLSSFEILPNPIENNFKISLSNDLFLNKNFSIFSMTGKKIFDGKLNNLSTDISLENISKGVYFLEIEGVSKKIIKL